MEKLKALQEELAQIDANAHNLADPLAAVNAKQREIINELISIVVGLAPASNVDRVGDVDETENTARPSLQAVADAVLELDETVANLDTRIAAIEQHPALSIPALDAPAPAAAPAPAPEPTQTTTAAADSAAQSGAAVLEDAAKP